MNMHIAHSLREHYFLKRCEISDVDRISQFYQYVCENTKNMERFGKWIYGLHPTKKQIECYIKSGFMHSFEESGEILGAVAITPFQGIEYQNTDWQIACHNNKVSVVHLLAVSPNHQGCGIARKIMCNVIELAKNNHSKAIRLDALSCNTPAHRLYQLIGFRKIGVCNWYVDNVGDAEFYLFELLL
jgi:ribosomal protein S18 acetylase RimI-like enzyme